MLAVQSLEAQPKQSLPRKALLDDETSYIHISHTYHRWYQEVDVVSSFLHQQQSACGIERGIQNHFLLITYVQHYVYIAYLAGLEAIGE